LAIVAISTENIIAKLSPKNTKRLLKNLQNTTQDFFLPHPVYALSINTVHQRRLFLSTDGASTSWAFWGGDFY